MATDDAWETVETSDGEEYTVRPMDDLTFRESLVVQSATSEATTIAEGDSDLPRGLDAIHTILDTLTVEELDRETLLDMKMSNLNEFTEAVVDSASTDEFDGGDA